MASNPPAEPPKRNSSTMYLVVSFALLILILFDPFGWGLRAKLGSIVGYLFDPIIGFGSNTHTATPGALPLVTILLASMILVIGTTAIRHFLVDWVRMARVQEAMRSFQKEFMQARKDNNTYKLKKLTDAQPEVMAMQADLSTEQLKPMAWTMLLVIPIFAWLGAFMVLPAHFHAEAAPASDIILVGMDVRNPVAAQEVGPSHPGADFAGRDFVVYPLQPPNATATGSLPFADSGNSQAFTLDLSQAPQIPASASEGVLDQASYTVSVERDGNNLTLSDEQNVGAVLLVATHGTAGATHAVVATTSPTTLTATPGDALYALVLSEHAAGPAKGALKVTLTAADGAKRTLEIGPQNTVTLPETGGARVQPHEIHVPWNAHWSMFQGFGHPFSHNPGFIPHWIILYSLFGIPIGQLAQRALKLWEYRSHKIEIEAA